MTSFKISRQIASPLEKVWALAADFTKAPGPGVEVVVEKQGDPAMNGAGTERTITIGSVRVLERLESVDPVKRSFTYKILSGAPIKNYVATASFAAAGSSTEVQWNGAFTPKIPGIGWILAGVSKKAINQYLDAVERAAR